MFYIHQTSCISPQKTFIDVDINTIEVTHTNKLLAIEPLYAAIPPGVLRRMGKAVRMGVGAAMPLLQSNTVDGIIIGTANSGQEDCVKFLNQIIEYNEGMLTPINFVQSAPNAAAAQIGLLTKNHGYNITHVHGGLAFEFAVIDTDMLLYENPLHNYLLGAVDDISIYNYNYEEKSGWYKQTVVSNELLYKEDTAGSIAGEGAAMFFANNNKQSAIAKLLAVDTLHTTDELILKERLEYFLQTHLPTGQKIDILLSGENGDNRLQKYYTTCQAVVGSCTIARFKHLSGEYPTATAMGLWLSCYILQQQFLPLHLIKLSGETTSYQNILIYNNYKYMQHSFMLVSIPD